MMRIASAHRLTECEPNVLVAFVRDSGAEVGKLQKTSGFLFAGLESAERNKIQNEAGPVRAWNATLIRTRYGRIGLLQDLAATRDLLVATHLPFPSVGRVGVNGGAFRWIPVAWDY